MKAVSLPKETNKVAETYKASDRMQKEYYGDRAINGSRFQKKDLISSTADWLNPLTGPSKSLKNNEHLYSIPERRSRVDRNNVQFGQTRTWLDSNPNLSS